MGVIEKIHSLVHEMEYKNLKPIIVLLSDDMHLLFHKEMCEMIVYQRPEMNQGQYITYQYLGHKLEILKCSGSQRIEVYSNGEKPY